jgi:hypothetical protein
MIAEAPANAESSSAGSSIEAALPSTPSPRKPEAASFPWSRATDTGVNPRRSSSATTNRPVCPVAR